MDEGSPSVSIIIFVLLLIIDLVIHGFAVATAHIREEDIEKRALDNKDKISQKLLKILENDTKLKNSMQLLDIILNMSLGGIVTGLIAGYFIGLLGIGTDRFLASLTYLISGLCVALVIMCFGVIIPRRLALRQPEKWAYACFYPVSFIKTILTPFVFITDAAAKGILYIFGIRGDDNLSDVTEEEIKSMVSVSHDVSGFFIRKLEDISDHICFCFL